MRVHSLIVFCPQLGERNGWNQWSVRRAKLFSKADAGIPGIGTSVREWLAQDGLETSAHLTPIA